jgi:hypothetical protein
MAGAFGSLAAAGFASDALEPAAGFFAVAEPSAAQSGVVVSARARHEARAIERLRVVGTFLLLVVLTVPYAIKPRAANSTRSSSGCFFRRGATEPWRARLFISHGNGAISVA